MYKQKYLKYKNKYLELKTHQKGGASSCLTIDAHGSELDETIPLKNDQMVVMYYKPYCIRWSYDLPIYRGVFKFVCSDVNNYENLISAFSYNLACQDKTMANAMFQYAVYSGDPKDRHVFKYIYDTDSGSWMENNIANIPNISLSVYDVSESKLSEHDKHIAEIPLESKTKYSFRIGKEFENELKSKNIQNAKNLISSRFEFGMDTTLKNVMESYKFIITDACRSNIELLEEENKKIGVPISIFIIYSIMQLILLNRREYITNDKLDDDFNLMVSEIHTLSKTVEYSHHKQEYTEKFLDIINGFLEKQMEWDEGTPLSSLGTSLKHYQIDSLSIYLLTIISENKNNDKILSVFTKCFQALGCIKYMLDKLETETPYHQLRISMRDQIQKYSNIIKTFLQTDYDTNYIQKYNIYHKTESLLDKYTYSNFDRIRSYNERSKSKILKIHEQMVPYIDQSLEYQHQIFQFLKSYAIREISNIDAAINFTIDLALDEDELWVYQQCIEYLMSQIVLQQQIINVLLTMDLDPTILSKIKEINRINDTLNYSNMDIHNLDLIKLADGTELNMLTIMKKFIDFIDVIKVVLRNMSPEVIKNKFPKTTNVKYL